MDLWIRSQDKDSLIKAEKIELIYDYLCNEDIQLIHIETDKGRIGSYSTQERALEVLDEIQKILKPSIITTNYECEIKENPTDKLSFNLDMNPQKMEVIEMNTYVYEMPEE